MRRVGAVVGALVCAVVGSGCACSHPGQQTTSGPVPMVPTAPVAPPSAEAAELLPPPLPPGPPPPACGDAGDIDLFVSPQFPMRGKPLRVVAVSDHVIDGALALEPAKPPRNTAAAAALPGPTEERHGGPPYFWTQRIDAPAVGKWTATLTRSEACGGGAVATKSIYVRERFPLPPPGPPAAALWPLRNAWSRSLENVYSAWIESMFEAPLDQQLSYTALHEVLRDPAKNFLFDYTGRGEDQENISIRPDCADLPYFLRAYFAFKLGLPFGWSRCTRGDGTSPPTCTEFASTNDPFPPVDGKPQAIPPWADPDRPPGGPWDDDAKRFGELLRTSVADWVQSGAGRLPAADEDSDYYPIALSAENLRPGTIFADPYGHVLVVAQRVAQTATSGGVLLAVDGQPDGTVGRKRFWRGNFLFAVDPALGSAGFKRFRPVVHDTSADAGAGALRRLKNTELPDFSATDQYAGGVEGFYDRMDDVLSPAPLDPATALLETVQALEEQVKTRVISVDNGRRFLASGKPAADMPEGPHIFEWTGDWEDFSTPSRDLRLLVAVDVARGLPGRVARRPSRYAMPPGRTPDQVKADLEALLDKELARRSFEYTRSDGSTWKLALRDVVDRQAALEVAYNPNECVEARWGAVPGSPEASTCGAHAPDAQVAKMGDYRVWFHERRRPPR